MKKIFALALAIVMMMAIALPTFADVKDSETAPGVDSNSIYGKLNESSAAEGYDGFDNMLIKYGVYQEYIITIPADVNFGYLAPEAERFEATRRVSASGVVINGLEYLVVKVASANTWQMRDQDGKSVPVDYDATLPTPTLITDSANVTFDKNTSGAQTILVVDHAAGNEGWEAKAGGNVDIKFTTEGTAQEGTYLDTLTFAVEIVETDPITDRPVNP